MIMKKSNQKNSEAKNATGTPFKPEHPILTNTNVRNSFFVLEIQDETQTMMIMMMGRRRMGTTIIQTMIFLMVNKVIVVHQDQVVAMVVTQVLYIIYFSDSY